MKDSTTVFVKGEKEMCKIFMIVVIIISISMSIFLVFSHK